MDCGIYRITCKTTGKFYIGSSSEIKRRWTVHRYKLKHNIHINPYLQSVYNKYGLDDFLFEIVEEVENKTDLLKAEQKWLDETRSFDRTIGYNLTDKAGGGALSWKSWIVTTPDGIEIIVENLNNFCKNNNLSYGQMRAVSTKYGCVSHRGYLCRLASMSKDEWENLPKIRKDTVDKNGRVRKEKTPTLWKITYPDSSEIIVDNLTKFCKENNLVLRSAMRVASGDRENYHGFKIENISKPCVKKEIKNTLHQGRCDNGFIVTTPTGEEIVTYNLEKFIREHDLTPRYLHAIAAGKKHWSNKGYSCRRIGDEPAKTTTKYIVTDPEGNEIPVSVLKDFCEERNLDSKQLFSTLYRKCKYKGYTVKRANNE